MPKISIKVLSVYRTDDNIQNTNPGKSTLKNQRSDSWDSLVHIITAFRVAGYLLFLSVLIEATNIARSDLHFASRKLYCSSPI